MNRIKATLDSGQKTDLLDQSRIATDLCLNFREAPLQTILNYLQNAAHLAIEIEPNVETERRIDLWKDAPVSKEEALKLLQKALSEKGYAAIHKGGMLAVLRSRDAKKLCIPLPPPIA